MKKQNGITLIALVITIIVMLILVGVTINVALNGGLIEKARTAGEQTQKQVEKEELISVAIGAYSSKNDSVTLSDLTAAIDTTKFKYDSEKSVENSTYVVEGIKSGIYWEINLENAEVKEYKESAKPNIYKVAYEWVDEGTGIGQVYYFFNDDIAYFGMISGGQIFYPTVVPLDINRIAFSEDYNTFTTSMDGSTQTFIKNPNSLFTYNPIKDETTNVYKNALYTLDGKITVNPLSLQTGDSYLQCYKYVNGVLENEGNNVRFSHLKRREDIIVSVDGTTIKWEDGNTYYLVENV